MNKTLITTFASALTLLSGVAFADDHLQVPEYGGVETFACDFNEGKDMDDLLKASKKRIYSHGDMIVHRGGKLPGLLLVIRGVIRGTMLTTALEQGDSAENEDDSLEEGLQRGTTIALPGGAHGPDLSPTSLYSRVTPLLCCQ